MSFSDDRLPQKNWLRVTEVLQMAASPSCLLFAMAGYCLMQVGGLGIDWFTQSSHATLKLTTLTSVLRMLQQNGIDGRQVPMDPMVGVTMSLTSPAFSLFHLPTCSLLSNLSRLIWNLSVWSIFGLAIVRRTVLRSGRKRTDAMRDSFRFACRKSVEVASAPLAVLVAISLMAIPVFAISWLVRFDVGFLFAGILWPFVLCFALLMSVLALGLAFCWPLMWGAIAAEDSDLFDAISRAYAYAFQRPASYVAYFLGTGVLGLLGWIFACLLADSVVQFAFWTIQIGGGLERVQLLKAMSYMPQSGLDSSWMVRCGGILVRLFNQVPQLLANAFSFSYFWTASAVIYLLMRFDVDQTALDDVIERNQESPRSP